LISHRLPVARNAYQYLGGEDLAVDVEIAMPLLANGPLQEQSQVGRQKVSLIKCVTIYGIYSGITNV
jgi:hypothetical protein